MGFRQAVGLMAQGQQRGLDSAGRVVPFKEPSAHLLVRHTMHLGICGYCHDRGVSLR